MAQITLTIPDDQIQRCVDALCSSGGYPGEDQPPLTRPAFAKRELGRLLKQHVAHYEQRVAMTSMPPPPDVT